MSKNIIEKIKQDRENLVKKTWSKSYFIDLLTDYVNEPELESHIIELKRDENNEEVAKVVKEYPVKKFRKTIKKILIDFGVDEKDAELSLIMEDKEEGEKTYEGNEKRQGSLVKNKKHKKIKAESKCPKWLKESYSEDGKTLLKKVALIYEE